MFIILAAEPGQWVRGVRSYSSQYNSDSWSAAKVIGAPQVYPRYGDIAGTWAQKNKDANEYIEVCLADLQYYEIINFHMKY